MAEQFHSLGLKCGIDGSIIRPIAIGPVVLAILLFLGSVLATLVPAVTVATDLVATFIALNGPGFAVIATSLVLKNAMSCPVAVFGVFVLLPGATLWLFEQIPWEYAPREDRGAFFVLINGPEGAAFDYKYMDEVK
jgi:multidrug efflux pump subunit AcrB